MASSSGEWTKVDDYARYNAEGGRRSTAFKPSASVLDHPGDDRRYSERKSYKDGAGDMREIVKARQSYNLGSDGGAAARSGSTPRKSNATVATSDEGERPIDVTDESDAETEVFVTDDQSWRKVAEVFGNIPGSTRRTTRATKSDMPPSVRKSQSYMASEGDSRRSLARSESVRRDEGDLRRSIASRPSQFQREEEGDVRRSIASRPSQFQREEEGAGRRSLARKSEAFGPDEGDSRRSIASRPSQFQREEEGDGRRSLARKSEAFGPDEGDSRRSIASRPSQFQREEEGDGRRSLARKSEAFRPDEGDAGRSLARTSQSWRQDEGEARLSVTSRNTADYFADDAGRRGSRRSSRLPEGSEQRMLSQPPVSKSSSESELFAGAIAHGHNGFQRKSEVIRPERPAELTLVLDADNVDEMKSIIWKFTEEGACVKALSRHCPKATPEDIRAGDVLKFINEEFVLDKEKPVTQKIWKDEQLEHQFLTLRFRAW